MKDFELKYGCNPNQQPARIYMADGSDLPLEILNGRPVMTVNFRDGFDDYFIGHWNGDPASLTLQESEVKAARFATHEEIAEMTRAGTFIPYHPALMDLLFFHDRHHSIYDWK